MPRKAKKGSARYYFTQKTEDAIIRYNNEERPVMRNRIYNDHIKDAFDKLCENIIHTFKFYYFDVSSEEVKNEVVSFLVMNMHKYTEGKGKAFSYFSIVAKNYLILHNNNNYKKMKTHDKIDVMDWDRSIQTEISQQNTNQEFNEFVQQMLEYWDNNINVIFRRQKDVRVADAVLHIFRIKGNIENFNKKALYILIREMTQSNTQHITRVINVMKKYQKGIYKEFQVNGFIDTKTTGSFVIHN
jgi:mevalonate kinase